ILQLRKTLESRLKISLPEDLGEALSNGTVLCQLANHVRPRSVSIIHIPSPAVPKLSAAKCRLNVENFIAACRRLGVPEVNINFIFYCLLLLLSSIFCSFMLSFNCFKLNLLLFVRSLVLFLSYLFLLKG
uniref:Calponin-homology (CH) domain-containing protein n=1 Tax=Sinocyclocheilus rhinocerous TaxID=307959 RepID=A0A673JF42_9TELE